MKRYHYIAMLVLSCMFSSLSFAGDFSVKFSAGISESKNPPMCYYIYKVPTKKEIADNAANFWNNLNKHTHANLDLGLLKHAEKADNLNIKTDKILFDVYNPSAMGFLYTKPLADYLRPDKSNFKLSRLLNKDYASTAAKDYIAKLNLLPVSTDELCFEQTRTIRGASSANPNDVKDFLQVVRFGRKLNGLKVIGPTRIVLRLGNDGELISVIKDWPQLVQSGPTANVESYEKGQWNQVITDHLQKQYKKSSLWSSVNVNNVDLVMYDDGENFVEPALHAQGHRIDNNGDKFSYDWVVPVLKKPNAKYKDKEMEQKNNRYPDEMR